MTIVMNAEPRKITRDELARMERETDALIAASERAMALPTKHARATMNRRPTPVMAAATTRPPTPTEAIGLAALADGRAKVLKAGAVRTFTGPQ